MTGFRQNSPEHKCGGEGKAADHRQRDAPVKEIGENTAEQAAAHAPNRIPANVQAHRKGDKTGMNFLTQIGHANSRDAA